MTTMNSASSHPLPVLFVSHGAPLFALEPGSTGPALQRWGEALGQTGSVRAVLVMSPHWMARTPTVMTTAQPDTWHDFGGFPATLYQLQYPAPGSPEVAQQVLHLLQQAHIATQPDERRPFDHGVWVPLMHLFPAANIAVLQLALPQGYGPREVYAMGAALQSLRQSGVLIVGSGSMTHNLGEFFGGQTTPAPYVQEFSRWVEAAIARADYTALLNYRERAPQAQRAHPSDDHFLPLFFTLGAAGWGAGEPVQLEYLSREVMYGMLAMDAFALH